MDDKFQFELELPRYERMILEHGEPVSLLYPIDPDLKCSAGHAFRLDRNSEPHYPVHLKTENFGMVPQYNVAKFWNFMGDATHCSEDTQSPYGLVPGDTVIVTGQGGPYTTEVTDVKLVRGLSATNWMWLITLQP